MSLKTSVARWLAKRRYHQLQTDAQHIHTHQKSYLQKFTRLAKATAFGKDHNLSQVSSWVEFRQAVPVRDYEGLKPYIDRIYAGEKDVLWPNLPIYFAKTSGTTSGTKYIPITKAAMPFHVQGAKDALFCYIHHKQNADFLKGKMLFLSGSPELETLSCGIKVGRLSGISTHYVPAYLQTNRVPTYPTNCIEDWEQKITRIIVETQTADLRLISGIPPWVQMFFEHVKKITGKMPAELWPNLGLFVQGGVDYSPYAAIITETCGRCLDVVEVFPASEGFFAIQDNYKTDGLMLLPKSGVIYEFIRMSDYNTPNAKRIGLQDVKLNEQYALIITTNAGLWAYDIGDTVRFTQLSPVYKLKVTGRTKHFISAFGEHVIVEEVNDAMTEALRICGGSVAEFTVAPKVGSGNEPSMHEWFVEFTVLPDDLTQFTAVLDAALQRKNSYYRDLRTGHMLANPTVYPLQPESCRQYMKHIGKLGGQNKFPRLANNRTIAEFLINFVSPISAQSVNP